MCLLSPYPVFLCSATENNHQTTKAMASKIINQLFKVDKASFISDALNFTEAVPSMQEMVSILYSQKY